MCYLGRVKSERQTERALAERAANAQAATEGRPLPYPNPWDALDPTKVAPGASDEEILRSYKAFREICRPRPCPRYEI